MGDDTMNQLTFVDEQHKANYQIYKETFPLSLKDVEYQTACYISALPVLFFKFKNEIQRYETPLEWFINWQMKYLEQSDDETDEEYEERQQIHIDYDLTSSMQQLGALALNLFNGYDHFNLMDCIESLDDENVQVLK